MAGLGCAARAALIGVAILTVPSGLARAATLVLQYQVEHPTYGNIGTYINTVVRDGDRTEVRTEVHIAVRVLGIRLFHQDANRTEDWQNGRLVGFKSGTDDNGKQIDVDGAAQGDGFRINSGVLGVITAPPQVHPSNPWSPQSLETDTMMSSKTGKVTPVVVTDTGEAMMTFDGQTMRLRQFFVDSDKHQVVWLDGRGVVVAFQTEENGAPVNFVLHQGDHPLAAN